MQKFIKNKKNICPDKGKPVTKGGGAKPRVYGRVHPCHDGRVTEGTNLAFNCRTFLGTSWEGVFIFKPLNQRRSA